MVSAGGCGLRVWWCVYGDELGGHVRGLDEADDWLTCREAIQLFFSILRSLHDSPRYNPNSDVNLPAMLLLRSAARTTI